MIVIRTLIVAGTFDMNGGERSGLIDKLFANYPDPKTIHNGGHYNDLNNILNSTIGFDVVFWFANVDNALPKVRDVKEVNPRCILVTSKRNDGDKYSFEELVCKALEVKANLVYEFCKEGDAFAMRVFDPLGVLWCDRTTDFKEVTRSAFARISKLVAFTRQKTPMMDEDMPFEVKPEFIDIIHEKAKIFHNLIQSPTETKRFLGNASFRCAHGFPSYRDDANTIIVSRRNVDKTGISPTDFVPIIILDDAIFGFGKNKPSIDTPVQVRLYKHLPRIKYMLHSHVYVKNAPFTKEAIPCGALEEVDSVLKTIREEGINTNKSFAINLIGHGSIVFATSLDYFNEVTYYKRNIPEKVDG